MSELKLPDSESKKVVLDEELKIALGNKTGINIRYFGIGTNYTRI